MYRFNGQRNNRGYDPSPYGGGSGSGSSNRNSRPDFRDRTYDARNDQSQFSSNNRGGYQGNRSVAPTRGGGGSGGSGSGSSSQAGSSIGGDNSRNTVTSRPSTTPIVTTGTGSAAPSTTSGNVSNVSASKTVTTVTAAITTTSVSSSAASKTSESGVPASVTSSTTPKALLSSGVTTPSKVIGASPATPVNSSITTIKSGSTPVNVIPVKETNSTSGGGDNNSSKALINNTTARAEIPNITQSKNSTPVSVNKDTLKNEPVTPLLQGIKPAERNFDQGNQRTPRRFEPASQNNTASQSQHQQQTSTSRAQSPRRDESKLAAENPQRQQQQPFNAPPQRQQQPAVQPLIALPQRQQLQTAVQPSNTLPQRQQQRGEQQSNTPPQRQQQIPAPPQRQQQNQSSNAQPQRQPYQQPAMQQKPQLQSTVPQQTSRQQQQQTHAQPQRQHQSSKNSDDNEYANEKGYDYSEEVEEPKPEARKFTGRCRLFVGNLTSDTTEEDFVKLFEPFGETSEAFLNGPRGFGFIRLDTRHNAENARNALDGLTRNNRFLRVRFAAHGAALRVKYLSQHVSNEMLEETFSMFGEVERAVIVVDDRGRPTGEGIVEFSRKPGALTALKRITDGVFLMTASLRPIAVEPLEDKDECCGLAEKFFQQSGDLIKDREQAPRFAQVGSVEYEYGQKWKNLYQMYKEREEMLKRNFDDEVAKLDMDQETAKLEMHTAMLRQDLQRRQEELRRFEEQAQMEVNRRLEIRQKEEERKQREIDMLEGKRRQQIEHLQQQQQHVQQQQQQQHVQQDWQQQQQQPQQFQQNFRGGEMRTDGRSEQRLSVPMLPPPVPPGMDRARAQGINVLGGGGVSGMSIPGAALLAGGVVGGKQEMVIGQPQQQGNLRQIRFEAQPEMGQNAGNVVRELGAKSASQGRDDFFDPKRARRY